MARTTTSTEPKHDPNVWAIRAGIGGDAHELFLNQHVIALSDVGLGDLRKLQQTRKAFYDSYRSLYPRATRPSWAGVASKFYRFTHEVAIGDIVVYPSLVESNIHVGIVTGPYVFSKRNNAEYPHQRSVMWQCAISKSSLEERVRQELGAARTFFRITRHASLFLAHARETSIRKLTAQKQYSV